MSTDSSPKNLTPSNWIRRHPTICGVALGLFLFSVWNKYDDLNGAEQSCTGQMAIAKLEAGQSVCACYRTQLYNRIGLSNYIPLINQVSGYSQTEINKITDLSLRSCIGGG